MNPISFFSYKFKIETQLGKLLDRDFYNMTLKFTPNDVIGVGSYVIDFYNMILYDVDCCVE